MCGWQHVGFETPDGKVIYTDWGQLSIELILAQATGDVTKGVRLLLSQFNVKNGVEEQLRDAILRDPHYEDSVNSYAKLDADAAWLIRDGALWSPKTNQFLNW